MAGYYLCRQKAAEEPFYISVVGANIYSIEELAFFMARYPGLIGPEIMNGELTHYVAARLSMPQLAASLDRAIGNGDAAAFAMAVFKESGYLAPAERAAMQKKLDEMMSERLIVRRKMRADALLAFGSCTAAIDAYRTLTESRGITDGDVKIVAESWYNRGLAQMQLLQAGEALASFRKALHLDPCPKYRKTFVEALIVAKPFARREADIKREKITNKELVAAEEAIAEVRHARDAEDKESPDEYLERRIRGYRRQTGL